MPAQDLLSDEDVTQGEQGDIAPEDQIKRLCNRDFAYRSSFTEYHNGNGTKSLQLARWPILSILLDLRSARRFFAVASLALGGGRYACSPWQVLHFTFTMASPFIAMMVCARTILHLVHFESTSSPALYPVLAMSADSSSLDVLRDQG